MLEILNKFYEIETGRELSVRLVAEKELRSHAITKDEVQLKQQQHSGKSHSIAGLESEAGLRQPSSPLNKSSAGPAGTPAPMLHTRSVSAVLPQEVVAHQIANTPLRPTNVMLGFRSRNTLHEGWLTKRKGSSTAWDRKYFVLTTNKVAYFTPRIKGNALTSHSVPVCILTVCCARIASLILGRKLPYCRV